MKRSINAWTIPNPFTFEEAFACAAKAGFDGIELNVDAPGRSAHSLALDTDDSQLGEIAALSRKYGVNVSGISTSLWGSCPIGAVEPDLREKGTGC